MINMLIYVYYKKNITAFVSFSFHFAEKMK